MIWMILVSLIAIAIGFLIGLSYSYRTSTVGTIDIDESDPERDLYTLNFEIPPVQIHDMKSVRFVIRKKN